MLRVRVRRGRPRKFGRAARSITITLPKDVIARLRAADIDVGRAIVGLLDRAPTASAAKGGTEVASYGRHAVILVPPIPMLRRLAGVQLVPVGNGRSLIALKSPHAIPQLELGLRDLLDTASLKAVDRTVLESVAEILRDARQSNTLKLAERSIIVLERRRRARS